MEEIYEAASSRHNLNPQSGIAVTKQSLNISSLH